MSSKKKKKNPYKLSSSEYQTMRREEAQIAKGLQIERPLPSVGDIVVVEPYSDGPLNRLCEDLNPKRVACEVIAVNVAHRHYTVRTPLGYNETFKQGCTK